MEEFGLGEVETICEEFEVRRVKWSDEVLEVAVRPPVFFSETRRHGVSPELHQVLTALEWPRFDKVLFTRTEVEVGFRAYVNKHYSKLINPKDQRELILDGDLLESVFKSNRLTYEEAPQRLSEQIVPEIAIHRHFAMDRCLRTR